MKNKSGKYGNTKERPESRVPTLKAPDKSLSPWNMTAQKSTTSNAERPHEEASQQKYQLGTGLGLIL